MTSALPDQLDEISSVIGHEGMLALVAACGGTRIYVPASAPPDHWLVSVLGETGAAALCEHFRTYASERKSGGGIALDIPAFNRSSYNKTRELLHQLDDGTAPAREIALKVGVTERTVYRRRKKYHQKMKSRQ